MLNKLYRIFKRSTLVKTIKGVFLELLSLLWIGIFAFILLFLPMIIGNIISYLGILNYQHYDILGVALVFNLAWFVACFSYSIREFVKEL